jgi:hypothetical protein
MTIGSTGTVSVKGSQSFYTGCQRDGWSNHAVSQ